MVEDIFKYKVILKKNLLSYKGPWTTEYKDEVPHKL